MKRIIIATAILIVILVSLCLIFAPKQLATPQPLDSIGRYNWPPLSTAGLSDRLIDKEEAKSLIEYNEPAEEPVYTYVYERPSSYEVSPDLTTEEKLQWIIDHESGGDIYANNGNHYLGIGQLQDHHYLSFINMSYQDTLNQANAYELQKQAMLAYIYARYGSVDAAFSHWVNFGFY